MWLDNKISTKVCNGGTIKDVVQCLYRSLDRRTFEISVYVSNAKVSLGWHPQESMSNTLSFYQTERPHVEGKIFKDDLFTSLRGGSLTRLLPVGLML